MTIPISFPSWFRTAVGLRLMAWVLLGVGSGFWVQGGEWRIRYLDSETGVGVPDGRIGAGHYPGGSVLAGGLHAVRVVIGGYRVMEATVSVPTGEAGIGGDEGGEIRVWLDPEVVPHRLSWAGIRERTGKERMLIHGFAVEAGTGKALAGVEVSMEGRGWTGVSGEDGYFEVLMPVPAPEGEVERVRIKVSGAGRMTRILEGVEVWRGGDWRLRLEMREGAGEMATVEMDRRGMMEGVGKGVGKGVDGGIAEVGVGEREAMPAADAGVPVRVPGMIRVRTAGGADYVSMETYVKRVLPAEWIPSWGALNQGRGMHALRAGAVAIRTYAVGFVHSPYSGEADICSTTSCQVYDAGRRSSWTDQATDETAGYVMVDGTGWVGFKLTEYSAENNGLGTACGDGFVGGAGTCRADPVCGGLGLARNGHGRGMCQTGSARWATGWSRVLSNVGSPHGHGTRTWAGILTHYYPGLGLKAGTPLAVEDGVEIWTPGNGTVASRGCAGGGIGQGTGCGALARLVNGEKGVIVGGPQQVLADGNGYTWWKVRWPGRGIEGWTVENFLQRAAVPMPECPCELALGTPVGGMAAGWRVRVTGTSGLPWVMERSTNLIDWIAIGSGRIPTTGGVDVALETGGVGDAVYFRAR